jgi:hypothetical protein
MSAWQHNQVCRQVSLPVIQAFVDNYMLPGGRRSVAPEPFAG